MTRVALKVETAPTGCPFESPATHTQGVMGSTHFGFVMWRAESQRLLQPQEVLRLRVPDLSSDGEILERLGEIERDTALCELQYSMTVKRSISH